MATPRKALALAAVLATTVNAALDLTAGNRRGAIDGLPDWSKAGYGSGRATALPDASQVGFTLTADDLKTKFGVIADDDQDDTDGLYAAITAMKSQGRPSNSFALIQLPPGKLLLTRTLPLDVNYVILRGAGNDPNNGGTTLEFRPDENTRYDTLTANGARWDMEGTGFDYTYMEDDGRGGSRERSGSASGGWLWPGRPMLQVGSTAVAPKYTVPHSEARPNRKDLFLGSVNFHFRNDTRVKGFMADQTKDIAGKLGEDKVYVDSQNTSWPWATGQDVWIGSPVRSVDYESWNVQNESYILNAYMYQDWFTVKTAGKDAEGSFITLDRPLRFNVYSTSESGGATLMENTTVPAKVMPIEDPIHHVGIENLYITQPMANLDAAKAVNNYGNMTPESAMHGILFKFARDSWVSGVHTYMTGSHPIATENARWLTIQNNYFDGSWNKGAGGNGYMRGSRVWDSVYYNNTLRNLRHFTFQWAAMGNVAVENDMDCDMNLHGGGEGFNLFERNTVRIAYDHRSGSCETNCGGEGGTEDEGTWGPIYWSAGDKASKWAGATGPQNVFFGNVMQKAWNVSEPIADYEPYYKTDGSLSNTIFEFGWTGSAYEHLSLDGETPVLDWMHNERAEWKAGLVKSKTDSAKSLFVKDVGKQAPGGSGGSDAASHMAGFSTVAIFSAVMLVLLA